MTGEVVKERSREPAWLLRPLLVFDTRGTGDGGDGGDGGGGVDGDIHQKYIRVSAWERGEGNRAGVGDETMVYRYTTRREGGTT